jgi:outer membrane protein OmpA-like peptidoglycan-associated protein
VNTYRSNPLAVDTDNDGLRDEEEVRRYRTRPDLVDTDAGSVADGIEVKRGTDPLNAKDDVQLQAEVGKAIALEGILFTTGSAEIQPASEDVLFKAYSTLKSNPDMTVQIQGHTDNKGARAKNVSLATNRANSVRDWLIARGIDGTRISTKGVGPDKPIAPNNTEAGRAKNRRIEFVRTK